jgi:hypothetical protein
MFSSVNPVSWKKWVGLGLIGLAGVWFAGLLLTPFAPFSIAIKAVLAVVFLVLMEGSFWLGTLIIGKQAVSRFWKSFKKKHKKRPKVKQKEMK